MRLRAADKATLYSGLAKMVRAGFGVPRAAESMLAQRHPDGARCYLKHLRDSLESGSDLAGATRSVPVPAVGELEKEIVAAGEKGGQIEAAYNHLADYFAIVAKTSRQIRRRLYYPLIVLSLAVILPALPKAVAAPKEAQSIILSSLATLGGVYLGLIALYFLGSTLLKSARTSTAADGFIHAIPLVGKVRCTLSLARFCKVLHIYLLSAFRVSDSFRAAAKASGSARLIEASERIATGVEAGEGLIDPLMNSNAFDPMFRSSFATAEESGDLDGEAARWSTLMAEEAKEAVERLGEWVPRIIYTLIAVFVIYQIFQLAENYFSRFRNIMP